MIKARTVREITAFAPALSDSATARVLPILYRTDKTNLAGA
jgi:hypothetical protein